ncbi:Hypothetical protein CAP_4557 [Chondromyces apiculatus DSM 436]|uniref:Uncharacterized protein n=1 Tax=Chondromyces apiculatus DSM 436 TaxID=1192034 RepID=A0A017T569_9BACT|nr:Hypothetical protein CAP_4557 [Chondromyces apiculatus DSM 436]
MLYREPVARWLAQRLVSTGVMPDHLTFVSALLGATSGLLVSRVDERFLVAAGLAFELRTIVGRARVALDEARQQEGAPPALTADLARAKGEAGAWVGVVLLYLGLFCHVQIQPPAPGLWSSHLSAGGVLALSLLFVVGRAVVAGHYRSKASAVQAEGHDAEAEALRRKALVLGPVSPGLDVVVLSLLVGQLWAGQLLSVVVGAVWMSGALLPTGWFMQGGPQQMKLTGAQPAGWGAEASSAKASTEEASVAKASMAKTSVTKTSVAKTNVAVASVAKADPAR